MWATLCVEKSPDLSLPVGYILVYSGFMKTKAQHRPGSIYAAIRAMLMVFILTPLSIPLLLLLSFIGQLELMLLLFVPGFLGGQKARSVKKAMLAALIVGAAYGTFTFVLVLALLELMTGLPLVGSKVGAGVDLLGGREGSSILVAVIVTSPFVLSLFLGAFIGAKTTTRR